MSTENAGLATNLSKAMEDLTDARNTFHGIMNSENSTLWDKGAGFAEWMNAWGTFESEFGEGYEEDFRYAGENVRGEGVTGALTEGSLAATGALVEGATQATFIAAGEATRITAGLVAIAAKAGEQLEEAYAAVQAGDLTTARHILVDVAYEVYDGATDVVAQGVRGGFHAAIEADEGLSNAVIEVVGMAREIIAAAQNTVLLFEANQALGQSAERDAAREFKMEGEAAENQFNMEQDAVQDQFNMEQDAVQDQFNMEQDAVQDQFNMVEVAEQDQFTMFQNDE